MILSSLLRHLLGAKKPHFLCGTNPNSMLTVLMPTYNGAATLPQVLDAYRRLHTHDESWNLIIVDNGSTDLTKEIISSFRQYIPLSYLFEPRRGKNIALNRGLSIVSGDLIVFTDDDVIPQPDWLMKLRLAADCQPASSIFGGQILPMWESPPEDWILAWVPLEPTFSILNTREEGPIHPNLVFGSNMAIRAPIFKFGYRFNEAIGPNTSNYAMGSETELLRRLACAGFTAWHCKTAIVYHIVRSSHLSKKWILRRAIRYGRGEYRLAMMDSAALPAAFLGIPRYLIREIIIQAFQIGHAKWIGNPETLFKASWQLNYLLGSALEARNLQSERVRSQPNFSPCHKR